MPQVQRPGTVTAAAIILFIVAGLSLLGSVCGGGQFVFAMASGEPAAPPKGQPPGMMDQHHFFAKEIPGYYAFGIGTSVLDILIALGLFAAGIGLWGVKSWSGKLAIGLTLFKLLLVMGGHIYGFAFILPAQQKFFEQHPIVAGPGAPEIDIGKITAITGAATIACIGVFQLAIAALIVMLLLTSSARDALAGRLPPPKDDERPRSKYEGYDEDDYSGGAKSPETGIKPE